MILKLPKWVGAIGFLLAFIAGSINSVGLLGFKHQAVSHLTGVSTFLSLEIAAQNTAEIIHLFLVVLSFLIGAILSGFVVGNTALNADRRYTSALIIESALLLSAFIFFKSGSVLGYYLCSAACGLQNSITSIFSGSLIRTTHVSGLFTDIGIMIGLRLRGQNLGNRKMILYCTLILGFIGGGIIGAVLFSHFSYDAILLPFMLSATIALSHWLYLHFSERKSIQ